MEDAAGFHVIQLVLGIDAADAFDGLLGAILKLDLDVHHLARTDVGDAQNGRLLFAGDAEQARALGGQLALLKPPGWMSHGFSGGEPRLALTRGSKCKPSLSPIRATQFLASHLYKIWLQSPHVSLPRWRNGTREPTSSL